MDEEQCWRGEKNDSFCIVQEVSRILYEERAGLLHYTFLSQRDPVVLQKDDFETVADHRIIVDHLADGCDQADDHLRGVVSRSSLHEAIGKKLVYSLSVTSVGADAGYEPFHQS